MANDFLKMKWRRLFHTHDLNKDNMITEADADIFSENFARLNNFTDVKAAESKTKVLRFWKEWIMRGLEQLDEDTFMTETEKAYTADKAKFREDARRLFSFIIDVVDVNSDKLISEEEFEIMMKSTGFQHYNKGYMAAFPQVKPGFISLDVYRDTFVEFVCNDDEDNIEVEKPRHYGFGIIGQKHG